MSPTFNGRSALERFERSYAIEIRNGIMFDFYPGLPHIKLSEVEELSGGAPTLLRSSKLLLVDARLA